MANGKASLDIHVEIANPGATGVIPTQRPLQLPTGTGIPPIRPAMKTGKPPIRPTPPIQPTMNPGTPSIPPTMNTGPTKSTGTPQPGPTTGQGAGTGGKSSPYEAIQKQTNKSYMILA